MSASEFDKNERLNWNDYYREAKVEKLSENFKKFVFLPKKEEMDSDVDFSNDFFNKLSQLQQKENYTDITIRCDTEIFKAHRIILSASSPVFDAMFQNPMKESLNQEIDIKDVKPEILRVVLAYIYSNKSMQMPNSIEMVFDILAAADKYMLQGLKNSCIKRLKSDLSINNVLKILHVADLYDGELKEYVKRFACTLYDTLKNSPEWKDLQSQNPTLIIDIMSAKLEERK